MNVLIVNADMNGATPAERAAMLAPAYKNAETLIAELKAQESVLAAQRKAHEDVQEQIREYLRSNMDECGITEISSDSLVIKLSGGAEAVEVPDESLVPDAFMRVKKEVDKAGIKKALKAGESLEFARIIEGRKRLTITIL